MYLVQRTRHSCRQHWYQSCRFVIEKDLTISIVFPFCSTQVIRPISSNRIRLLRPSKNQRSPRTTSRNRLKLNAAAKANKNRRSLGERKRPIWKIHPISTRSRKPKKPMIRIYSFLKFSWVIRSSLTRSAIGRSSRMLHPPTRVFTKSRRRTMQEIHKR